MVKKANKLSHDERLNKRKVGVINFISFLLGFSVSITTYIVSSYLKEVGGAESISVYYLFAYILILFILLNFHKLIRSFGKSTVFLTSGFLLALSAILIVFLPVSRLGAVLVIINVIFFDLCFMGKDIILESYSTDKMSGRIRGLHLTLLNLGFISGPIISTIILEKFSFQGVFFLEFLFASLIFIVSFLSLRKTNHHFKPLVSVGELIKKVIKRKNILRIYYISFILEFFYFVMVVYTPIYMRNLGMDWKDIGIIFSIMLIPFVLVQYPAGSLADRKTGEKEFIIIALFIMAIATSSVYFINSTGIYIWITVLFLTRIGAALLEVLRDSYFYKRVDGADVDIIDFFRTSRPFGFICASFLSVLFLLIFPLESIFILLAFIILSGLYPAFCLEDNLGEDEVC